MLRCSCHPSDIATGTTKIIYTVGCCYSVESSYEIAQVVYIRYLIALNSRMQPLKECSHVIQYVIIVLNSRMQPVKDCSCVIQYVINGLNSRMQQLKDCSHVIWYGIIKSECSWSLYILINYIVLQQYQYTGIRHGLCTYW